MEGAKPGYGTSSIDDRRDCGDAARRRAAPVGNSHRSAHRLVDLRASGGRRGVPALLGRRGRAARYPTLAGAHDFGADRGAARICRRHVPGLACGRRSGNLWAIGAGKYDRRKPPADWRRLADSRRALLAQSAGARAKGLWHYTGRRPKHRNSIPWHRDDLLLTSAQSAFAVAMLLGLHLSILEAALLAVLFFVQLIIPQTHLAVTIIYLVLSAFFVFRNRSQIAEAVRNLGRR